MSSGLLINSREFREKMLLSEYWKTRQMPILLSNRLAMVTLIIIILMMSIIKRLLSAGSNTSKQHSKTHWLRLCLGTKFNLVLYWRSINIFD